MHNFTNREKNLLKILGAVVAVTLLYSFIIEPIFIQGNNGNKTSGTKKDDLYELEKIYKKYQVTVDLKNKINNSIKNSVSISSIVDEIATSHNIIKNKVDLREREGKIHNKVQKVKTEIKFEGVAIKPLLSMLDQLESSSTFIKIKKVSIYTTSTDNTRYDATIEVESFIKKK